MKKSCQEGCKDFLRKDLDRLADELKKYLNRISRETKTLTFDL